MGLDTYVSGRTALLLFSSVLLLDDANRGQKKSNFNGTKKTTWMINRTFEIQWQDKSLWKLFSSIFTSAIILGWDDIFSPRSQTLTHITNVSQMNQTSDTRFTFVFPCDCSSFQRAQCLTVLKLGKRLRGGELLTLSGRKCSSCAWVGGWSGRPGSARDPRRGWAWLWERAPTAQEEAHGQENHQVHQREADKSLVYCIQSVVAGALFLTIFSRLSSDNQWIGS